MNHPEIGKFGLHPAGLTLEQQIGLIAFNSFVDTPMGACSILPGATVRQQTLRERSAGSPHACTSWGG